MPTEVTAAELIQRQIDEKYDLKIIKDNTKFRNEDTLKAMCKFEITQKPIQQITEEDIKDFYKSITYYSDSVIVRFCQMRGTLSEKPESNELLKRIYAPLNPKKRLKRLLHLL